MLNAYGLKSIVTVPLLSAAAAVLAAAEPELSTGPSYAPALCRPVTEVELQMPFKDCPDAPELVALPPGRFRMGELGLRGQFSERPIRTVTVSTFAIGRFEVTWDEWNSCVVAGSCAAVNDAGYGRGRRPVINVRWIDAKHYVAWLSDRTGKRYRLPTEAEWEYAARAGTETVFSWGDEPDGAHLYANLADQSSLKQHPDFTWNMSWDDGYPATSPVGSFQPNGWGFFDMVGNVWEWVEDCWHPNYLDAPGDQRAWVDGATAQCDRRSNRGAGWGNHARSGRSAARDSDLLEGYSDAIGFRVVRDLE